MGRTLALLPGSLVVAGDVASLFGGPPRLKLENVPHLARVNRSGTPEAPSTPGFTLSADAPAPGELVVDVIRLVTAPEVEGNARTASSLVRRLDRPGSKPAAAAPAASSSAAAASWSGAPTLPPASALLDALVEAIISRAPAGSVFVRPRALLSTTLGKELCLRLDAAGLQGCDLATFPSTSVGGERPDVVVDAFEVRKLDDEMARLSGAGQGPTLAAGLAPHVTALMVDLAGGADVWKSGYDAFARRVAALQVERALHASLGDDAARAPAPCRISGSAVFPPLSSSESRLSPALEGEITRLAASGEKNPKLDALVAQFHKRLVHLESTLAALRLLEVEVRVPALQSPPEWWNKQDALNAALATLGVRTESTSRSVVVMGTNDALSAHLVSKGVSTTPAASAWFHVHVNAPAPISFESSPSASGAATSGAAASGAAASGAAASGAAASGAAAAGAGAGAAASGAGAGAGAGASTAPAAAVVRVLAPEAVDPQATSFSAPLLDDDLSGPRERPGTRATAANATSAAATAARSAAAAPLRAGRAYDEPFGDPSILAVAPFLPGTLRVVVDGVAVDDAESRLDVTSRRGDDRLLRLLGVDIPAGAVVCIERDPPLEPRELSAPNAAPNPVPATPTPAASSQSQSPSSQSPSSQSPSSQSPSSPSPSSHPASSQSPSSQSPSSQSPSSQSPSSQSPSSQSPSSQSPSSPSSQSSQSPSSPSSLSSLSSQSPSSPSSSSTAVQDPGGAEPVAPPPAEPEGAS